MGGVHPTPQGVEVIPRSGPRTRGGPKTRGGGGPKTRGGRGHFTPQLPPSFSTLASSSSMGQHTPGFGNASKVSGFN
jgi:hypothetical protein